MLKLRSLSILLATSLLATASARAQQPLKVDQSGNPTTTLNLGGSHVVGLPAISNLDAGVITTGRFAPARLGTGTPSSATVLRGDGSWITGAQMVAGTNIVPNSISGPAGATFNLSSATGQALSLQNGGLTIDQYGYASTSALTTLYSIRVGTYLAVADKLTLGSLDDAGLSRTAPNTIALGNGTAGNSGALVKLGTLVASGNVQGESLGVFDGANSRNTLLYAGKFYGYGVTLGPNVFATGGDAATGRDAGLFRVAPGTVALGDGTPGDASGTLNVANLHASGEISGHGEGIVQEEVRASHVSTLENAQAVDGDTLALIDVTGAGSVSYIQLAYAAPLGSRALFVNSTITITVDGVAEPSVPLGLFFLTQCVPDAVDGSNTWAVDDFSCSAFFPNTSSEGYAGMGCFRRLFIPYSTSCKIELTVHGGNPYGVYSHVHSNSGTPSAFVQGRKTHLHIACTPLTTVAANGTLPVLDVPSGQGLLDSVQVVYIKADGTQGNYLEGNPSITLDGSTETYGGAEDTCGFQFYARYMRPSSARVTESWGIPNTGTFVDVDGTTAYGTSLYRFFHKDPRVFNTSAAMSFANGQANQGLPSTAVQMGAVVFYYLSE